MSPRPEEVTIEEIDVFVRLAEPGQRVKSVAAQLNCGPSDITKRRRALEAKLGRKLFLHRGSRIWLTPDGEAYLPHAKRMAASAAAGFAASEKLTLVEPKRLRLGYTESPTALFLSETLRSFAAKHPSVKIHEETPWGDECVRKVRRGQLDLALSVRPFPQIKTPRYEELVEYRMYCVAHEEHKFGSKAAVSLRDMYSDCLVMMGADAAQYNRHIRNFFADIGEIRRKERCPNFHAQLTKVAACTGVALAMHPMKSVLGERRLKMIPIEPAIYMGVGALFISPAPPVVEDFIAAARTVIETQFELLGKNARRPIRSASKKTEHAVRRNTADT